MRRFLSVFFACLLLIIVLLAVGALPLFYDNDRYWLSIAIAAAFLALPVFGWLRLEEKIAALEKRIQDLENPDNIKENNS